MDTLTFIQNKFNLDLEGKMPIEIPNFGRNQLAEMLPELDFKIGVEVGVASGEYSKILCDANPQMTLYGVDPFIPLRDYRDYTKRDTFRRLQSEAEEKLLGLRNYTFIRETSMEAVKDFKDKSLDFVYIDGNHNFQNVTNDIVEWSRKIRPGGIISGHDFFKPGNNAPIHVVQVLKGYTDAYRIKPWFVLGNEADNEGLIRDKPRSWMWVIKQ